MHRPLAILTVLALTACGATESTAAGTLTPTTVVEADPQTFGTLPDMALVSGDGQVAVVRAGSLEGPLVGLIAADGVTMISTTVSDDRLSTTVTWSGLADGAIADSTTLDGELTAIATDPAAKVVALTGVGPAGTQRIRGATALPRPGPRHDER